MQKINLKKLNLKGKRILTYKCSLCSFTKRSGYRQSASCQNRSSKKSPGPKQADIQLWWSEKTKDSEQGQQHRCDSAHSPCYPTHTAVWTSQHHLSKPSKENASSCLQCGNPGASPSFPSLPRPPDVTSQRHALASTIPVHRHGVGLWGLQKLSTQRPHCNWGPGIHFIGGLNLSKPPYPTAPTLPSWLEQPSVETVGPDTKRERKKDCQGDILTFRVQSLDLQLQGRVLQVKFTGCGDDLNAMDEVNDGIAAQDLACGWGTGIEGSDREWYLTITPLLRPRRSDSLTLWQRQKQPTKQSPQHGAGSTKLSLRSQAVDQHTSS